MLRHYENASSLGLCLVCFLLVFLVFLLLPWKLEVYAHAPRLLALISLYITCKPGTNSMPAGHSFALITIVQVQLVYVTLAICLMK